MNVNEEVLFSVLAPYLANESSGQIYIAKLIYSFNHSLSSCGPHGNPTRQNSCPY